MNTAPLLNALQQFAVHHCVDSLLEPSDIIKSALARVACEDHAAMYAAMPLLLPHVPSALHPALYESMSDALIPPFANHPTELSGLCADDVHYHAAMQHLTDVYEQISQVIEQEEKQKENRNQNVQFPCHTSITAAPVSACVVDTASQKTDTIASLQLYEKQQQQQQQQQQNTSPKKKNQQQSLSISLSLPSLTPQVPPVPAQKQQAQAQAQLRIQLQQEKNLENQSIQQLLSPPLRQKQQEKQEEQSEQKPQLHTQRQEQQQEQNSKPVSHPLPPRQGREQQREKRTQLKSQQQQNKEVQKEQQQQCSPLPKKQKKNHCNNHVEHQKMLATAWQIPALESSQVLLPLVKQEKVQKQEYLLPQEQAIRQQQYKVQEANDIEKKVKKRYRFSNNPFEASSAFVTTTSQSYYHSLLDECGFVPNSSGKRRRRFEDSYFNQINNSNKNSNLTAKQYKCHSSMIYKKQKQTTTTTIAHKNNKFNTCTFLSRKSAVSIYESCMRLWTFEQTDKLRKVVLDYFHSQSKNPLNVSNKDEFLSFYKTVTYKWTQADWKIISSNFNQSTCNFHFIRTRYLLVDAPWLSKSFGHFFPWTCSEDALFHESKQLSLLLSDHVNGGWSTIAQTIKNIIDKLSNENDAEIEHAHDYDHASEREIKFVRSAADCIRRWRHLNDLKLRRSSCHRVWSIAEDTRLKKITDRYKCNEIKKSHDDENNGKDGNDDNKRLPWDKISIVHGELRCAKECQNRYEKHIRNHTGRWTAEEIKRLRHAIQSSKVNQEQQQQQQDIEECDWDEISQLVRTRNASQCYEKWELSLKPGKVKGEWSLEEDEILRHAMNRKNENGERANDDWKTVAAKIKGRDALQCQRHWSIMWSTDEEARLIEGVKSYIANLGCRKYDANSVDWSRIATSVKSRSCRQCRIRYGQLRKQLQLD